MKKAVSFVLAALFITSALLISPSASGAVLTGEGVKIVIKAAGFACDMYRVSHYEDYSDEIFYDVAKMYPEAIAESYDGEPVRIVATLAQIKATVRKKWDFMTDASVSEHFMKDFDHHCKLENGTYELVRHSHGGDITYNDDKIGVFSGYTSGEDGIFNAYFKVQCAGEPVDDVLGAESEKFWSKAASLGYPGKVRYEDFTYVEFEGNYYRSVQKTRMFTVQLYDGGYAELVEDKWVSYYPINLRFIGGDVNSDGDTDNKDVVALFRTVSTGDATEINTWAADTNADYFVDNKDVVVLFRYCSGDKSIVLSTEPHPAG